MEKTTKEDNGTVLLKMAEEALKNYEQSLKTGLKLQKEATQWWTKSLQQTAPTADLRKWFANLGSSANDTVFPAAEKQLEEILHLLEKNNRDCVELARKATEAARTCGIAESQAKWIEFWNSSMLAARSNAEVWTQANSKMLDKCVDFFRQNRGTNGWSEAKAA
jgi:hypothetical protein